VFDNLKKTVAYTVTHTLPELFPFMLYLIINIPLGVGTIGLLFIDLVTDIIPAITLAYERTENDIMMRKPRDQETERMVDGTLIGMTCGQNGLIESIAGMFVYCVVLGVNGFRPSMLIGLRADWENSAINNLRDSYGQEWTYAQRKLVEFTCYTAYFYAIVVAQWFNILACKTRRNSVLEQGMYNNHLHVAVVVETAIVIVLSFCPGLDYAFNMCSVHWSWFVAPLPFAMLILVYSEFRKLFCRYFPGCWVERELIV
jgi:sodium/potassium-transporting ATPase subunit alpha